MFQSTFVYRVTRQLPPRKIVPWLGLGLELGLVVVLRSKFPWGILFKNRFNSYPIAKLMTFITFKSLDKTCSDIEKTWFLLIHWVAIKSKKYEKIQKQSSRGAL